MGQGTITEVIISQLIIELKIKENFNSLPGRGSNKLKELPMENQSSQNFSRAFQGIWIPKEVWLDRRLTYFEKCLLSEIHSLNDPERGCFASNQYFMDFFNERERKIQEGLSKLKKYGYIRVEKFDGRIRTLRSDLYASKSDDKTLFNTPGVSNSAPLTCRKSTPLPHREFPGTDNIDDNKGYKETPPTPSRGSPGASVCDPPKLETFGKFVQLKKEEYQELCNTYGVEVVKDLIDQINDYLLSTGKKPYKDYSAVIRQWIRRRQDVASQGNASKTSLDAARLIKSISECPELVSTNKAIVGHDYVEFPDIRGAYFKVGEPGFVEKVTSVLRKMNVYHLFLKKND